MKTGLVADLQCVYILKHVQDDVIGMFFCHPLQANYLTDT